MADYHYLLHDLIVNTDASIYYCCKAALVNIYTVYLLYVFHCFLCVCVCKFCFCSILYNLYAVLTVCLLTKIPINI